MRIGSGTSTHAAGMSALWHDVDFVPDKRIDVPTVEKGLEEMPLPSEQQQLPEGFADPFARQDNAYEMAAEQMERGLKGVEFLYGKSRPAEVSDAGLKTPPAPTDPVAQSREITRTMVTQEWSSSGPVDRTTATVKGQENLDATKKAARADELAQLGGPRSMSGLSDATKKGADAAQALAIGVAGSLAGQGFDPVNAANAVVEQGASVVQALTTSKLAVGLTEGLRDAPEPVRQAERDAAKTRVRGFEKTDEDDQGF